MRAKRRPIQNRPASKHVDTADPYARQRGVSYVEIMAVVILLGIIAAAAMPDFSGAGSKKLEIAARQITQAIRFAQSEAIRKKIPHGVDFDTLTDRARVYSLPGLIPAYDVYHPIDKKLYDIQLSTGPQVAGVDLVSANFVYANSSVIRSYVGFSVDGYPKYSFGGPNYMLVSGAVTLEHRGQQALLSIAPMTGRVTIQTAAAP